MEFLERIKIEVFEQKTDGLIYLNKEIVNIKDRISKDLDQMCMTLQDISNNIKTKIWKTLDSQEIVLNNNYEYFFKKIETINILFSNSLSPEEIDLSNLTKYLDLLKIRLFKQTQEIPKYTSYTDEKHSFNQVISIIKKSFELFEEHFQDLLDVCKVKDLSDDRIQTSLMFQAEKSYTLDRTVACIEQKGFDIVFEKDLNPQHDYNLNSIAMLNDEILITSSIDRSIHLLSIENNQIISTINEMKFSPMVLCLLETNKQRSNCLKNAYTLDSKQKEEIFGFSNISKRNEMGLLASGGGDYDPNIYIWSLNTGKKLLTLPGHTRHITTIAQLPDPDIIATGGYDSKIFIWSLNAGEPKLIINKHSFWIFKIKISHCNSFMASCSWDRTIIIWRMIYDETIRNEYKFQDLCSERVLKDDFEVCNINFSMIFPDIMLSSNIGKSINVWDLKTSKIIKEMKVKQGFANELMLLEEKDSLNKKRFNLEGIFVITSSIDDNRLRVFSIEKGEEIFSIEHSILNISAYNLNPKLQFFRYKDGDIGLANVSHNDKNIKIGLWRVIYKGKEP